MEKSLAWTWSICLALAIARALTGGVPNWIDVFCPLSAIVVKCWTELYLKGKENMKYWEVKAETPYCGEECREAIKAETYDEAEVAAWNIMYDNAMEWYDDVAAEDYDWDDYLGGCSVYIYEITYEEYLNILKKGI